MTGLQVPGQKDFVELICDVIAYTHVQTIRGTPSVNKVMPFAVDVVVYNWIIRPFLDSSGFLNMPINDPTRTPQTSAPSSTRRVAAEIVILTALLQLSRTMKFFGKLPEKKEGETTLMNDIQDVAATMGISTLYLMVKEEFGIPVPDQV